MKNNRNVKDTIVKEAFKLFLTKPYEKVTYSDIQEATGFSRGAILYYFNLKQDIFEEVINQYLFLDSSIFDFYNEHIGMSFLSFIHIYCDWIENKKKKFKEINIPNYSFSLANITLQALYYLPEMKFKAHKFNQLEKEAWVEILKVAIETGEIKKDIDMNFIAGILQTMYYGTSYVGIASPEGLDVVVLREQLLSVYEMIKV